MYSFHNIDTKGCSSLLNDSAYRKESVVNRVFWMIIALSAMVSSVSAQEFTTLHTLDVRSDQTGDQFAPIVTDDELNLYFAYVNTSNRIVIGKKSPGQAAQTFEVTPLYAVVDPGHTVPTIALDREGYIHVFGPMHHTEMDYLKSNRPYDVTGGFTRQNAEQKGLWLGITHKDRKHITYPFAFYDNELNPWVTFRSRAGSSGWEPGTNCAQLAMYDVRDDSWHPVGGNSNSEFTGIPGDPSPKPNCMIWSDSSEDGAGSGYQAFYAHPSFDKNGRLHYALRHVRDTGSNSWGQDLLYMYSDDNGRAWNYANGVRVPSDPVVIVKDKPAVMWAHGPTGGNHMYGAYPGSANGMPVVGYASREGNSDGSSTARIATFANGRWTERDLGFSAFPGRLLIDSNNVWYIVTGRNIWVSIDDGASWDRFSTGYAGSPANANFDGRYFKQTNKLRFAATIDHGDYIRVNIVEFVSPYWSPPEPIDVGSVPLPPSDFYAE